MNNRVIDQRLEFKPNYKQALFLRAIADWAKQVLAYGGGGRAGKSYSNLVALINRVVTCPGDEVIVCRKVGKDLKGSIRRQFMELLPPALLIQDKLEEGVTIIRTVDERYPSFIYWTGMDDRQRLGSKAFSVVVFEEGTEFDSQDFTYMYTRLSHELPYKCWSDLPEETKQSPFVRKKTQFELEHSKNDRDYYLQIKMILIFNPPEDPNHWINELIYNNQLMGQPQDCHYIGTTTYDNVENLSEQYLTLIKKLPKHEYDRMVLGRRAAGIKGKPALYRFDKDKNIFSGPMPAVDEWYTGTDFGWTYPTTIWFTYEHGVVYVWMICQKKDMDLPQFLRKYVNKAQQRIPGNPKYVDYCDHQHKRQHSDKGSQTSEEIMRDCGRFPVSSYSTPSDRAILLNECLDAGILQVHESCELVVNTCEYGLQRDEKGEVLKDGFWDHIGDALGYGVWGILGGRCVPSERIAARNRAIDENAPEQEIKNKLARYSGKSKSMGRFGSLRQ